MASVQDEAFQLFDIGTDIIEWSDKSSKSNVGKSASRSRGAGRLPPSASKLTPEGGPYPLESKFDCNGYVIHCSKHKQVAISKRSDSPFVWLPFTPQPTNK